MKLAKNIRVSFQHIVRAAFRSLIRAPRFSVIVLILLSFAIVINLAAYDLVDAVYFKAVPYANASRLVQIWETRVETRQIEGPVAPGTFLDWERDAGSLEAAAAFRGTGLNFDLGEDASALRGYAVSPNLFSVLGEDPFVGRTLMDSNDAIVLSHGLWHSKFGANPSLVGRTIATQEGNYVVTGIMPEGFEFPIGTEASFWLPLDLSQEREERAYRYLEVIGLLSGSQSQADLQTELEILASSYSELFPELYDGRSVSVRYLHDALTEAYRGPLLLIWGTVVVLFIIMTMNAANLLLTRRCWKQKEIATRHALGGRPSLLLCESAAEALMLSGLAGVIAVTVEYLTVSGIRGFIPTTVPRIQAITFGSHTLFASAVMSLACAIFLAMPLVLQQHRLGLGIGNALAESPKRFRVMNAVLVGQTTVSVGLLVCAGLMVSSFVRLVLIDPGFDPDDLLTLQVGLPSPPGSGFGQGGPQRALMLEELLNETRVLRGVERVGAVDFLPLRRGNGARSFYVRNRDGVFTSVEKMAQVRVVSPDYFATMDISIEQGRALTQLDDSISPEVVIVNRRFVQQYLGRATPLGQIIDFGSPERPRPKTVVGVIENVLHFGLAAEAVPEMYLPYKQYPPALVTVVVKTADEPGQLLPRIQQHAVSITGQEPIFVSTMEQILGGTLAQRRATTTLLLSFAIVAIVLTMIGVYSLSSYTTARRRQEYAIRLSVGGSSFDILRLIVGQQLLLISFGIVGGAALGFGASAFLVGQLFEVSRADIPTYSIVVILQLLAATGGVAYPALQASRLDPSELFREAASNLSD